MRRRCTRGRGRAGGGLLDREVYRLWSVWNWRNAGHISDAQCSCSRVHRRIHIPHELASSDFSVSSNTGIRVLRSIDPATGAVFDQVCTIRAWDRIHGLVDLLLAVAQEGAK